MRKELTSAVDKIFQLREIIREQAVNTQQKGLEDQVTNDGITDSLKGMVSFQKLELLKCIFFRILQTFYQQRDDVV